MHFDLVVHNGTVLTVNPAFDTIEDGIVCIRDGKIENLFPHQDDSPLPEAREFLDAKGGIIMPGLVNTHTHLPMTLFRGLADDLPLDVWLNEHIFPAEGKYINPENVRLGAELGCAEMLLAGTTTVCDGYFLEDEVAAAVLTSGMRAILGQGVIDFPAPGVPDPSRNVEAAVAFVKKWHDVSPLISPSVFCHSPYTCSEETLKKAKRAASSLDVLFQIHVAETQNESTQIPSQNRESPFAYLNRIGLLDQNTLLVHAVWADDHDVELIAGSGAKISHNPESNMKLASGIAPVSLFLDSDITVGLGTDGCASNNNLDLFQELDTVAKLHKVSTLNPTVMDARTVLQMGTIDGARAIGLQKVTGSLEPGKQADLIILDTRKPHLVPLYNPVSQIVYAASGADVKDVIVSGKIIVHNREVLSLDVENIIEEVASLAKVIGAHLR
jgi:5-methylthioadenosine/S-adenosylhomocysteine deaminase